MYVGLAGLYVTWRDHCSLLDKIDFKSGMIEVFRKKNGVPSYLMMTHRLRRVMERRAEKKNHPKWELTNQDMDNHRSDNTHYLNDYLRKAQIPATVHMHECKASREESSENEVSRVTSSDYSESENQ